MSAIVAEETILEFRKPSGRWQSVGNVMSFDVGPIDFSIDMSMFYFSGSAFIRERPKGKLAGYSKQATIRVRGITIAYLLMREFLSRRQRVEFRARLGGVAHHFSGLVTSANDSFCEGMVESEYVISGFNKITVKKYYGSASKKRHNNNKNLRKIRRRKPKSSAKNALRSKRNRKRV